jgi:hypothetical protein
MVVFTSGNVIQTCTCMGLQDIVVLGQRTRFDEENASRRIIWTQYANPECTLFVYNVIYLLIENIV